MKSINVIFIIAQGMKKSIPYSMLILHDVMQDDTLPVSSAYILQFYQDWCRIHSSELKE